MLPFYLRDSRHASKKGTKRQRPDKIQDKSGGPVQSAITNDLIDLRERFRERLLDRSKQCSVSSSLWKPGCAFSIFKDVFRSSKTGMLHLLSPVRCDREAYSQLIYGVCLALFKESFGKVHRKKMGWNSIGKSEDDDDDVDHFNDASFALFLLLALFEINPLAREIGNENPLELLPISLRSSEDPRAPNRRCFSKNIRIDRQHFALMLRMKELALARRSDCERLFFELQRLNFKGEGQNNSEIITKLEFPSDCAYGMSTDTIEVLERIFLRLQFCEYTGPVGAEAFAGHPEYPHNSSIACQKTNTCQENATTRPQVYSELTLENESYHIEACNGESDEITSFFQEYMRSVIAIRIPTSGLNGVKRLKRTLQPLFLQTTRMRSTDSREDHHYQCMDNNNAFIQSEGDLNDVKSERDHDGKVQYRDLIFERDMDTNLKKALHSSVMTLLARDELLSPLLGITDDISRSSLDADEVSSIGHGGISLATRHGAQAYVASRSPRSKNLGSKHARFTNQRKVLTKQSLANEFLTLKQSASSEEDSVDSEITGSSFSDTDSIEENEISVATSAFGKKALKDLLQNVAQDDINISRGNTKKRSRKKRKPGLNNVKNQKNKQPGLKTFLTIARENEENEVVSTATSAFGKRALEDLLKHIDRKESEKSGIGMKKPLSNEQTSKAKTTKNHKRQKNDTKTSSLEYRSENKDMSMVSSAFGKRALEDLLKHAVREEYDVDEIFMKKTRVNKQQPKSKTSRNQNRGTASTKESFSAPKNGDEEASVATSAYGKRALEDLLQKVHQDDNNMHDDSLNRRKRQKRKSNQRKVQTQKKGGPFLEASLFELSHTKTDNDTSRKYDSGELLHATVATDDVDNGENDRNTGTESPLPSKKDDGEESSVATSAFGKRALEDLLQNVV